MGPVREIVEMIKCSIYTCCSGSMAWKARIFIKEKLDACINKLEYIGSIGLGNMDERVNARKES